MEGLAYLGHLFNKGGLVMYPLLLFSLGAVAIAFERYSYFKTNWQPKDGLVEIIHSALDEQNWNKAVDRCNKFDTVVSRTIKAGLALAASDNVKTLEIKDAFEERMSIEVTNMRKHLDYLSAMVTLSPLLGLLGTVTGMISAFGAMDEGAAAMAISGGVGEALVATATGLCVAVVAFLIYTYFNHQYEKVVADAEHICYFVLAHRRGERA